MKIEKRVSENGEVVILIDGEKSTSKMSRQLTGTTSESGMGVFSRESEATFDFGEFGTRINFDDRICIPDTAAEIAANLVSRIEKVRAWVKRCKDTSGVVEVEDVGAVIDNLYAEGKLYYRNRSGRFSALD